MRNIGYGSYPLPSVVGKLGNSFYFPYFESFYYKSFSILLRSSVSHLNLSLCIGYVPYAMQKFKKSPASSLLDLQIAVAALLGEYIEVIVFTSYIFSVSFMIASLFGDNEGEKEVNTLQCNSSHNANDAMQ